MNNWRNIMLCLFIFGYAAIGCSQDSVNTDPANLLGRWRMIKVIHDDSTIVKPKTIEQGVEIEFLPEGKIKGIASKNPMVGKYEVKNNDSISIQCYYQSKIAEPTWGDHFVDAIEDVSTYEIRGDLLYLNYSKNQLIFRRME